MPQRPSRRPPVDKAVLDFIEAHGGSPNADLAGEMITTILRMIDDGAGRGDFKLLNSTLKEMRYSFKVFAPYRNVRKVSMFGSARIREHQAAYRQAESFAREISQRGFMVITGAGPGIMQAGHAGAGREMSFGVNIRLPFEQSANPVIEGDPKLITFKYFFTRKLAFLKETHAIALFPGGFGTHDEGYETLTLVQTGKREPLPLVYIDVPRGTYWRTWDRYVQDHLLRRKFIDPSDLSLYKVTDDVGAACDEITRFYRIYHSMRYVSGDLVMRLTVPLTPPTIQRLNAQFKDIVESGRIEASASLPDEQNEPEIASLPRLKFRFVRRSYGRLRQLIDAINASQP